MGIAAFARPYRRFDLLGKAAIGLDVLTTNHDIASCLSPRNCQGEIDLLTIIHRASPSRAEFGLVDRRWR
jgi:hypothetical protein